MKKLPSYMRVTRGLALANQKNALAVNNFECRWNFGEGQHQFFEKGDSILSVSMCTLTRNCFELVRRRSWPWQLLGARSYTLAPTVQRAHSQPCC